MIHKHVGRIMTSCVWTGIRVLCVYQSSTPELSGRAVNFLYVVITYRDVLLVSATPAVYELLPQIELLDFYLGVK